VNATRAGATVLIVDDDLGFVWWLGEIFHELGCRAVPAMNCREALCLAESSKLAVDLIVVNPGLQGVPEMVKTLRRVRSAKVVAIPQLRALPKPGGEANTVLDRPSTGETISRSKWIRKVRGVLAQIGTRAAS
jgi:DNA-binding response OmpR family regulator